MADDKGPANSESDHSPARSISGRYLVVGLLVILIVGVLSIGAFAKLAMQRFASMVAVSEAVAASIKANDGRWPANWSDVAAHLQDYSLEQAKADVEIEFDVDTKKIVAEPGLIFQAIKPTGVCYQAYEKPIMKVVEALQQGTDHLPQ